MARQFDVCRLPGGTLVMVIQHDFHEDLNSRVVAVLEPGDANYIPFAGMMPRVSLGDLDLRLAPHTLATVPISDLGNVLGNAAHCREDVVRAFDLMLTGI